MVARAVRVDNWRGGRRHLRPRKKPAPKGSATPRLMWRRRWL